MRSNQFATIVIVLFLIFAPLVMAQSDSFPVLDWEKRPLLRFSNPNGLSIFYKQELSERVAARISMDPSSSKWMFWEGWKKRQIILKTSAELTEINQNDYAKNKEKWKSDYEQVQTNYGQVKCVAYLLLNGSSLENRIKFISCDLVIEHDQI